MTYEKYARFQNKIVVSRAISVIKDLTCLVGNSSKTSMKNDMLDFNMIKVFFCINTRKFFVFFLLDGSSIHQAGLKLTLMGLLGDILVLLLCEFICDLSAFFEVHTVMVIDFYGVIMLWRKLKR